MSWTQEQLLCTCMTWSSTQQQFAAHSSICDFCLSGLPFVTAVLMQRRGNASLHFSFTQPPPPRYRGGVPLCTLTGGATTAQALQKHSLHTCTQNHIDLEGEMCAGVIVHGPALAAWRIVTGLSYSPSPFVSLDVHAIILPSLSSHPQQSSFATPTSPLGAHGGIFRALLVG